MFPSALLRSARAAACAAAIVFAGACDTSFAADAVQAGAPTVLFNGRDLKGWSIVGQNNDPAAQASWLVRGGLLTTTGAPSGYIRTEQAFKDYRLRVEWRWVSPTPALDAEGKGRARNSGVLLHQQGEDKVWPRCLEAQLQEKNAGDFIAMDGVVFKELLEAREKAAAAAGTDETARQRAMGGRRVARSYESSENPPGEWNTYEIVCRGDTVSLTVNGVLQNTATGLTATEGRICLQSEGAPIEFRNVLLTPLD
jgi:hypothetical protein